MPIADGRIQNAGFQISLNNHLSTNVESDLLYEKIDYTKVNSNLNKYRKNAEEFLESFVGGDTIV